MLEKLLIGPLGTNFSEILIKMYAFLFKDMHLKMSSGKWQLFCIGLNVFTKKKNIENAVCRLRLMHCLLGDKMKCISCQPFNAGDNSFVMRDIKVCRTRKRAIG